MWELIWKLYGWGTSAQSTFSPRTVFYNLSVMVSAIPDFETCPKQPSVICWLLFFYLCPQKYLKWSYSVHSCLFFYLSFHFEFQTYQRVFEGPVASYHPEDFHIHPNPGTAPVHYPHGVHEEEGAGMSSSMHCFDQVFYVSVGRCNKSDFCYPDSKVISFWLLFALLNIFAFKVINGSVN